MKKSLMFLLICLTGLITFTTPALSQEFPWVDDFNKQAHADMDSFKKKLTDRFSTDMGQVERVFKEMKTASDAYMAFKLGEMSKKPLSQVMDTYGKGKTKGWGALAKSLGIKPGSAEFHALKKQDDLYHGKSSGQSNHDKKEKGKKKHKKSKKK